MMEINSHNKSEYQPMHTVEHLINRTADLMWECGRSVSAHIERKKSKMDFALSEAPTPEQVKALEDRVNNEINRDLPVTYEYVTQHEALQYDVDLNRIPDDASQTVRIVRIGDYDTCLCIGAHVEHTLECGTLRITTHSYKDGIWRVRFKLDGASEVYAR